MVKVEFNASVFELFDVVVSHIDGSDRVEDEVDFNAFFCFFAECEYETLRHSSLDKSVGFKRDGFARRIDGIEHCGVKRIAIDECGDLVTLAPWSFDRLC